MAELRVEALILDMDGVVIDSGQVYARLWRAWGDQHGIDYDTQIAHVHPGRPPLETIRLVAPELDAAAEAARYNDVLDVAEGFEGISAMPGAADLLASLPAGRWTIATSAHRGVAPHWLRSVGLPVPAALVTADDVLRGKPAPDPYLRAAELLAVDPGRCLVIEDAPAGVEAAKGAGATVLALRTTHGRADLGAADHHTSGLHTVTATLDGGDIVVSWEPPPD
jgi:sugar-phosphatase